MNLMAAPPMAQPFSRQCRQMLADRLAYFFTFQYINTIRYDEYRKADVAASRIARLSGFGNTHRFL